MLSLWVGLGGVCPGDCKSCFACFLVQLDFLGGKHPQSMFLCDCVLSSSGAVACVHARSARCFTTCVNIHIFIYLCDVWPGDCKSCVVRCFCATRFPRWQASTIHVLLCDCVLFCLLVLWPLCMRGLPSILQHVCTLIYLFICVMRA